MIAMALHLALLAAILLWLIRRPFANLRAVFTCWWAGIVFYKIVPLGVNVLGGSAAFNDPPLAAVIHGLSWAGALLLFRAALELILWERPKTWWFRLALGFFVLGQLLGAVRIAHAPVVVARTPLVIFLCLPLLFAFRWRSNLRAAGLLQAFLALPLTFVLGMVGSLPEGAGALSETAGRSAGLLTPVVDAYSLLGTFVLARRLHLFIRRIRLRLVVSHLLVSVVPVSLAVLFLLLSGTLFVSTYRGQITVRQLRSESEAAVGRVAAEVARSGEVPADPFGSTVKGQTVLLREEAGVRLLSGTMPQVPKGRFFDDGLSSRDAPLLWDGKSLYIRSRWEGVGAGGDSLRVEALCLLDSLRMAEITDLLGTPAWINPLFAVEQTGSSVSITHQSGVRTERTEHIDTSTLGKRRLPGGSVIPVLAWDQEAGTWVRTTMPVLSSAGFGEQIGALFTTAHENPLATAVLVILGFIALLLAGTVWITAAMVSEMVRSITRSVRALTTATQAVGRGDLSHRISLEANDELWDVAESFNRMSGDLVRMQEAEVERRRMEEDLRLAREIQDRLLPSGAPDVPGMDLAGTSIPAREVGGDYYDFIAFPDGKVWLVVADVSGKGTPAAMLMSAFRAALRSQDLTLSGPAEVLGRVNGFIHSSVDPGRFITAFVAVIEPDAGRIRYANAGHDAPLILDANGSIRELTGGGLILGMLPKIVYEDANTVLDKGSALLVYTDGVTEARNEAGEFFGIDRLRIVLGEVGNGPACGILETIMNDLRGFRGGAPQSDDITMMLARRM